MKQFDAELVRVASGLTLLEVLAALSILSLVAVGAGSWCVAAARAQSDLSSRAARACALDAALGALLGDLDASLPVRGGRAVVVDPAVTTLTVRTSHAAGGAPAGWRDVSWRLDERAGALLRSERALRGDGVESQRTVLRGVDVFEVREETGDEAGGDVGGSSGGNAGGSGGGSGEVRAVRVVLGLVGGPPRELRWEEPR